MIHQKIPYFQKSSVIPLLYFPPLPSPWTDLSRDLVQSPPNSKIHFRNSSPHLLPCKLIYPRSQRISFPVCCKSVRYSGLREVVEERAGSYGLHRTITEYSLRDMTGKGLQEFSPLTSTNRLQI